MQRDDYQRSAKCLYQQWRNNGTAQRCLLWLIKKKKRTRTRTHAFLAQLAVPVGLDGRGGALQRPPGQPISSGPSDSAIWVLFAFGRGPGQPAQYATVFGDGAGGKKERKQKLQAWEPRNTKLQWKEDMDAVMYASIEPVLQMHVHVCLYMYVYVCVLISPYSVLQQLNSWISLNHSITSLLLLLFFFSLLPSFLGPLALLVPP